MKENKSIVKKIFSIFTSVFLILSIVFLAFSAGIIIINKDNPENAFILGYKPIYIKTGSMEPTLKVNGLAIVKQIDYDDVKVDDIIMYQIDEKTITHRVIDITDDGIRTKGDNNSSEDTYYLKEENVKGKVVCIINITADYINAVNSPNGVLKFVILPIGAILIIVSGSILVKTLLKRQKEEELRKLEAKQNKKHSSEENDELSLENSMKSDSDSLLDDDQELTVQMDSIKFDINSLKDPNYKENKKKYAEFLDLYFKF